MFSKSRWKEKNSTINYKNKVSLTVPGIPS